MSPGRHYDRGDAIFDIAVLALIIVLGMAPPILTYILFAR